MCKLETAWVFDWYDGPVVGLGRVAGRPGICLISLLAYDADSRRRAYALIPLDDDEAAALTRARDVSLEIVHAELRALCAAKLGTAGLVIVDDDGAVVHERTVAIDAIRRDLILDIEDATLRDRAHWLTG